MVQQCLGVVHTMLWNTAIWVFEDCLKLVQEPSEGLQVHTIKLEEKLPQGECLLGGHIHIFGQSSLKVLLTFSSGGKEFPFTEIFVLLSRSTHSEKDRGLILPRANAKPPGADPGSLAMGGSTPMIKAWAILATHVGEVGLAATSSRRWLGKLVFHYPCLT